MSDITELIRDRLIDPKDDRKVALILMELDKYSDTKTARKIKVTRKPKEQE